MYNLWSFLDIAKTGSFPFETTVEMAESIKNVCLRSRQKSKRILSFVVGPNLVNSPIIKRRIFFSYQKNPKIDFKYFEAGMFISNKRDVYILLEG